MNIKYNPEALEYLVHNLRANADKQIIGRLVKLEEDGSCKMCAEGIAVVTFAAMAGYTYEIREVGFFHHFRLERFNHKMILSGYADEIMPYFFGSQPLFEFDGHIAISLMELNDTFRLSFNEIADIIEEQYIKKD